MAYQGFLIDKDHASNQSAELASESDDECLNGRVHDSLQLDEHQNAVDVHSDIQHDEASHSPELQNRSDVLADIHVDRATSHNHQLHEIKDSELVSDTISVLHEKFCSSQGPTTPPKNESQGWKLFKRCAPAVVVGIGAVAAAPLVISAVGFGAAGITAGSFAAQMMSAAAVANGGGVAAGSLVAILQSVGVVGLSATASATIGVVAGGTTMLVQEAIQKVAEKGADDEKVENGSDENRKAPM